MPKSTFSLSYCDEARPREMESGRLGRQLYNIKHYVNITYEHNPEAIPG